MTLQALIFILAGISFAIPAVRAMLRGSFDYTNTGLALLVLAILVAIL